MNLFCGRSEVRTFEHSKDEHSNVRGIEIGFFCTHHSIVQLFNCSLILLMILFFTECAHAQTSGGPDNFGYHWASNQDPIGSAPVYSWKNISISGAAVTGLGDDNAAGPFNLGFYFNYYGIWYNTLWIGSNGWVSFQNIGSVSAPFTSIPSSNAPQNFIAGMLADLTLKDVNDSLVPGAKVYFRTNNSDSAIVQYDSIPFYCDSCAGGYSGRSTFQIILAAYSISFQYKKITNSSPAYDLHVTGLKTGIEDSAGTDGLQVLSDTFPANQSVVKFFSPGTFSTNDLNGAIGSTHSYPNPCSNFTDVCYSVSESRNVTLTIQDVLGRQIEIFLVGKTNAGNHSIRLNTSHYTSGIYFYTLSADEGSSSGKIIVE